MTLHAHDNAVLPNTGAKYRDAGRFLAEAWESPVSAPAGRALVLRIALLVAAGAGLATAELFRMYAAARAEVAFINVHNLPLSPPDPAPALVGGMLGAGVTLLLAGAAWEVASRKRIVDLPRLAAAQFGKLINPRQARRAGRSFAAAAGASARTGRSGARSLVAPRLRHIQRRGATADA